MACSAAYETWANSCARFGAKVVEQPFLATERRGKVIRDAEEQLDAIGRALLLHVRHAKLAGTCLVVKLASVGREWLHRIQTSVGSSGCWGATAPPARCRVGPWAAGAQHPRGAHVKLLAGQRVSYSSAD